MTEPHFTPRSVIEITLANPPDSSATALPDPCAGTAEFSLMAVTVAHASSKEPKMPDRDKRPNDQDLIREARELGCNDPLMQQLADRVEALRGGMAAIKINPSLASCQLIATQSLEGAR